jgi:hypothetical protein
MTTDETAKLARECWEICQRQLPSELASSITVIKGDPAPHSKSPMRLRLRPKKRAPSNFWGGWTWYEMNIGHMRKAGMGLNLGDVAFIQSPEQLASGGGAYARATIEILRSAQKELGDSFAVGLPAEKGKVVSLSRTYPVSMKSFPVETAGQDLARIIERTLPAILRLPDAAL